MFTTQASSSPKKYVPVELRPKEYRFGGSSPRTRRFVANIRQLVKAHCNKDGERSRELFVATSENMVVYESVTVHSQRDRQERNPRIL
jgi:hypothetical protein